MLDIKLIRTNPDLVKEGMKKRNKNMDALVDEILEIDAKRRKTASEADMLKNKQNTKSKTIPAMKKAGEDTTTLFEELKGLANKIKECDAKISELELKQKEILLSIPNIPHKSVPKGEDDTENLEMRKNGTPREFSFKPQAHWDLGSSLNILDPETAAKVTGSRFHFYRGLGAKLERSIINLYLDTHTKHGYTEILPPFMANKASMTGTGQLPKFAEDMYKIEGRDYYLIPTAEVPVTNMSRNDILDGKTLPNKFCAYSACFRGEVGAAGRDQKGLIRQHQFNKVELVKYARPENSYEELEALTNDAERVLQILGLPYRVVTLCGGDLGFSSAKTYDIEVWMPSYGRYLEISSCSNFEDYQARRANIKFKDSPKEKAKLVHTLNGSGVAIGRTVAAILENYQNEDGTITVPEALVPYMGTDIIK